MKQNNWPLIAFDLSQIIEPLLSSIPSRFRRKTPWEIKLDRDKKIALRKERKMLHEKPEEDEFILLTEQQVRYLQEAPLAKLALMVEVARCKAKFQSCDMVINEAWNLLGEHRQK